MAIRITSRGAQFTAGAVPACAANSAYADPGNGSPFQVQKFYYMVDSKETSQALLALMGPFGMEIDGVQRQMVGLGLLECTVHWYAVLSIATVREAIACHHSQLAGLDAVRWPNRMRCWRRSLVWAPSCRAALLAL